MLGQGFVKLRNLVALGQIGIEVVFSCEDAGRVHTAIQRHGCQSAELDCPAVQNRQRSRKPQTYRAYVGVRRVPKPRGAAAEDLAPREQLYVHFEPDDWLVTNLLGNAN